MTRTRLDAKIEALPTLYPGPGGAAAVIRDGVVIARHAWGWADIEQRIAFTPATLFRVCSISKQFTCATVLSHFPDLSVLDADVAAMMPRLTQPAPPAATLAHNQSGLRDYWATAMVCGATVERPFGDAEAAHLIGLTRTLHFAPGSGYSYCNQNFRMLGDIVASRTATPLATLMRRHILLPAGMETAGLVPNTETMPDGTIGYEGTMESGYRAAVNRILWTGDAGLAASLDDMIAWEQFIDATRDDPGSIYQRLSAPVTFSDGSAAQYGFGLARMTICGRPATGHGGGLRGWRSFRCTLPGERLSAVVLFNHMSEPRAAVGELIAAALDHPSEPARPHPAPHWQGSYEEPITGLAVRIEPGPEDRIRLYYSGRHAENLDQITADEASGGTTTLRCTEDGMWMDRGTDHQSSRLIPCDSESPRDIAGVFHAVEYDATLTVTEGGLYGAFSGFLGQGMMQPLLAVGRDIWRLPMPRALDDSPPGDWTLSFERDAQGDVVGVQVGCWLARRISFKKV